MELRYALDRPLALKVKRGKSLGSLGALSTEAIGDEFKVTASSITLVFLCFVPGELDGGSM